MIINTSTSGNLPYTPEVGIPDGVLKSIQTRVVRMVTKVKGRSYRIARNFRGLKFSRMSLTRTFRDLIFARRRLTAGKILEDKIFEVRH